MHSWSLFQKYWCGSFHEQRFQYVFQLLCKFNWNFILQATNLQSKIILIYLSKMAPMLLVAHAFPVIVTTQSTCPNQHALIASQCLCNKMHIWKIISSGKPLHWISCIMYSREGHVFLFIQQIVWENSLAIEWKIDLVETNDLIADPNKWS